MAPAVPEGRGGGGEDEMGWPLLAVVRREKAKDPRQRGDMGVRATEPANCWLVSPHMRCPTCWPPLNPCCPRAAGPAAGRSMLCALSRSSPSYTTSIITADAGL